MKIGILIVFFNNEKDIDVNLINSLLTIDAQSQICLINNGSKDATLENLLELKEHLQSLYVLDIKRNKGNEAAIKAGARFLINRFNLKQIGYINVEKKNDFKSLNVMLQAVDKINERLISYNLQANTNKQMRRILLKNIFSIIEYVKRLENGFKNIKLEDVTS